VIGYGTLIFFFLFSSVGLKCWFEQLFWHKKQALSRHCAGSLMAGFGVGFWRVWAVYVEVLQVSCACL
jgi:hypothetical protein